MSENLIKSKKRVQAHGEVFTPKWIIEKMLDIPEIKKETEKLDSTFLEPSAGEGYFLVEILRRKLSTLTTTDKKSWETYALRAIASIYAIELLEDNLAIARIALFRFLLDEQERRFGKRASGKTDFYKAAQFIIHKNIVQGNTLQRLNKNGEEIRFSEWRRVKGTRNKIERLPFTYSSLFKEEPQIEQLDLFETGGQMSLFEDEQIGSPRKYKIVEIHKVYKELLEDEQS